jgi:hypothetical protein
MIEFKDFVPELLEEAGFLGEPKFQSFQQTVDACNGWLEANPELRVVHIETVVLPNVHHRFEEGSQDVNIREDEDYTTPWNQFVRVWFERK